MPRCRVSTSATCSPTVSTGFSEVIGSWNTALISRPRSARSLAPSIFRRSWPAYSMRLAGSTRAFSGSRRRIDMAETVLPLPDSPTSASVEFSRMSKLTPRTASTTASPVVKRT